MVLINTKQHTVTISIFKDQPYELGRQLLSQRAAESVLIITLRLKDLP